MREYTKGNEATLTKVVCNGCGRTLRVNGGVAAEDFLSVEKTWGYFSQKDGEKHAFDLCEACYDRLCAGFAVPASTVGQSEWL